MKLLLNLAIALASAAVLSGCIIVSGSDNWDDDNWQAQQRENSSIISELELNSSRDDVIEWLGNPSSSEAFSREGAEIIVLYYRTQHRRSDGETTRDETTPLVFRNNRLIGWGEDLLMSTR